MASAGELYPKVVVSVPAFTPYIDDVLQGIGQAQDLLRPGQDAHNFSLSSSQRHLLAAADIIIIPDAGMSPFLGKLLDAEVKRGAVVVTLSALEGAEPLPYANSNPWLDAAKEVAKKTADADSVVENKSPAKTDEKVDAQEELTRGRVKTDPHLWLDPIRMANIAMPLAEAIAARSPSHRAELEANATALAHHLREEVDPALRAILAQRTPRDEMSAKPVVPFITYHAAYQYFMARYGLENRGEITQRPEDYFGAGLLHDVISRADHVTIHCVISEGNSPLVKRVANASGAKIIILSPEAPITPTEISSAPWVHNDYERMLQKTAESFAGCL